MAHNAGPAPIRGVSCIYNILILPVSPILAVVYKTIYGNGHIFNKKRLLSWDGALAYAAAGGVNALRPPMHDGEQQLYDGHSIFYF